jgi:hypothetical protein
MQNRSMRALLLSSMIFLCSAVVNAQINLTGQPYSQDFNTLASSGTSSSLPSGWFFVESGSNANALYTAGTGSGSSGDTYSFGLTSSDRSLGGLQSGSLTPVLGAYFINNTGAVITSIKITYKGEQWRLGATGRADALDFQYSLDATSLTAGTWTDVNSLDFSSPVSIGTVGALDGNLSSNQSQISHTLSGLTLAAGAGIFIRWNDFNASGADDGLAIDDFTLETVSGSDNVAPLLISLSPMNNANFVEPNPVLKMTFNEPVTKGTGLIVIKKKADGSQFTTIDVASSSVAVNSNSVSIDLNGLSLSTTYFVEIPATAFKDIVGNVFAGFTGDATWSFTTKAPNEYRYDFNNCSSASFSGWTAYSLAGDSVWTCSIFGNGSTNGLQINGFVSGVGAAENDDWIISPQLDLSSFNFVGFTMDIRTKFSGPQPQFYIATNQSATPQAGSAAWQPLTVFLPKMNSDVWTNIPMVDLSAYKSSSTYIAIRYVSSQSTGAARLTLDNIHISNPVNKPASSISFTQPGILHFDATQAGVPTVPQPFSFQVLNPTSDLTISVGSGFTISSDNVNFGATAVFTTAQQIGGIKTCYVRYTPTSLSSIAQGQMIFTSPALSNISPVQLRANSYLKNVTLDVVNWNIEWFGSTATGQGPSNDDLAQANIKKIMDSLDADLYAFAEVVDVNRFKNLIESLSGYGFTVADFASNAPDGSGGAYASGQKLAFAYRKSVVNNIEVRGLMRSSTTASSNWASGRFPYLLRADIVNGSAIRKMNFILVHGKSGNTSSDHKRRFDGAKELKDTLDLHFNAAHLMLLGDFNDDLDSTISTGISPALTSYDPIVRDSTDADRYKSLSLQLSKTNSYSVIGYEDVVDHLIISNELEDLYIQGSVRLVRSVESWVNDYANTTSDHYPLLSRFLMPTGGITSITAYDPNEIGLSINGNPAVRQLSIDYWPATGKITFEVYTASGVSIYQSKTMNVISQRKNQLIDLGNFPSGTYLLRVINNGKHYVEKFVLNH